MAAAALPNPLNLDVVALDPAPALDVNADPVRRAVLACRRADARLAPGDAVGARETLEQPSTETASSRAPRAPAPRRA
jgi:hypothetical protein